MHPRKPGDSPRSPSAVSRELSQCKQAVDSLEREVKDHRKEWEKTMRELEEHRVKVAALSQREELLAGEVEEKERRVSELEAMLEEVRGIYALSCDDRPIKSTPGDVITRRSSSVRGGSPWQRGAAPEAAVGYEGEVPEVM